MRKPTELRNIVKFGNGKVRPKNEGMIPVYGGNGILGFCNDYNYKDETIIIGRVGAYCGSVYYENKPLWVSDNALAVKPINGNNAKFIYYFLQNLHLNQFAEGSSHPLITQTLLNSIKVEICEDVKIQEKIADVISNVESKIELLSRQNKTLETLAQASFRHNFIDNVCSEWTRTTIGNVLRTVLGGTPSTIIPAYWDGNIPWINSGAINKFRITEATRFITTLGLQNSNTKLLPKGSTVLAITGATMGQVSLLEINTCANQSVVGVIPNEQIPKEFVFLWIKYKIEEIILNETGGAQPHINKNDVNETEIIVPPKEVMQQKIQPIVNYFEKITANVFQIQTLIRLKDTLLPKFMSGELRIKS